ncbi:MAG: universal stress protein [Pseudomonadota bacterium]
MRRFRNILFVFEDGLTTDQAFQRAANLARRNDAQLTIAHCLDPLPHGDMAATGAVDDSWSRLQDEWRDHLMQLSGPLRNDGIEVDVCILSGMRFREIIALAVRREHDLVVKPATRRGGLHRMLFGSTDMHLIRKCPVPVWLHQEGEGATYRRIMAAVDVGDTSPGGEAVTRFVLDLASSLAIQESADLHIVHAWQGVGERLALGPRRQLMPTEEIEAEAVRTEERHRKLLADTVAPYIDRVPGLKVHLVRGEPQATLARFANDREIDLVVMGSLGHVGLPGVFVGSTAEETLHQVSCSVLTVKPEGFVSPIH